jgi:hypothetical protein
MLLEQEQELDIVQQKTCWKEREWSKSIDDGLKKVVALAVGMKRNSGSHLCSVN